MRTYALDENKQPYEVSTKEWAATYENFDTRIVAQHHIGDKYFISTVFLGLDHSFGEYTKPILWESMVFGDRSVPGNDLEQIRYTSHVDAAIGHIKLLRRYKFIFCNEHPFLALKLLITRGGITSVKERT